METVENKTKVGAGIITMSVIYFILEAFGLLGLVVALTMKDQLNNVVATNGIGTSQVTTTAILISLVMILILISSLILILMKKPIGAYLFIGITVLSIIYNIVTGVFTVYSIFGLILPGLMIFFLYRKKEIYFSNLKF